MAIYHNRQKHHYAAVDAAIIRENMLSLAALGLLTVLLDRPAWWEVHPTELARTLSIDEHALAPLFAELEQKGFVQLRCGKRGRCYDVYERPQIRRASVPMPPVEPAEKPLSNLPDADLQKPVSNLPEADPPEEPVSNMPDLDWPDKPVPGQPMSDRNRAYALQLIRERFPIVAKKCDLNDAIRDPRVPGRFSPRDG
ncbi:MAG: hypothetical protein IKI52_02730 [Clostridia bacterium]|nr:hypothetical protein [Clostridia bacterium]MBR3129675.1 hypothetical protein [Clostridia bacterium]